MRIATWNINSVRMRAGLLARLDKLAAPDVVCLQETKVVDELFPHEAVAALYPHRHVKGMKAYNGVAILSKLPFTATGGRNWCGREDARHITAKFAGGVEVHNFYVPAGGDTPDPVGNPKFAHKLEFLAEMQAWLEEIARPRAKRILVGDLNIAPLEADVWSHKQLLNVVSHTPLEVDALARVQSAHNWTDAVRHLAGDSQQIYSWWSYRARDWRASNRGRRLDHIWVTPALKSKLKSYELLPDARDWPKCSDHVPVVVEVDI
ncbi:MAG: exodeoxyribonuclease III [Alphaproteobacteria bacterium]|nr:exodeoxyribonuclease III [Alphaproteobacteria bacterium]